MTKLQQKAIMYNAVKNDKEDMAIKLSVHKNTLEKRKRKELRKEMIGAAKTMSQAPDINGYAIIIFGKKGGTDTAWQVPNGQELMLPEKARMAIAGTIHNGQYTYDEGEDEDS